MNLGLMKRRAAQKSLPYDAEVEWIGNQGTSYIDTLFKPSNKTKFEIVFRNNGGKTAQAVFGCRDNFTTKNTSLWVDCDTIGDVRVTKGTRSSWNDLDKNIDTIGKQINFTMGIATATLVVDNNTYTWTLPNTSFKSNYSVLIFTQNNAGVASASWNAFVNIEVFKIFEDEVLIRDYMPVRIGQIGCFYDKVSKQLFEDARGVGFIIGNDK